MFYDYGILEEGKCRSIPLYICMYVCVCMCVCMCLPVIHTYVLMYVTLEQSVASKNNNAE